ncbi:hypothetical protein QFC22_001375 [Naganishia vaughanmartiniae]|uniref:Uncharacterized protein n=1 Tax=Naganishia vaughanmartiniae TaxID=1424756 RepID=A0ACC2XKD2_9TREE|nr:hypothetical protein QFC22_001375 [Naganishia vaughanmartiniae]
MVGVAAAVANLEEETTERASERAAIDTSVKADAEASQRTQREGTPDISSMMDSLTIKVSNDPTLKQPGLISDYMYLPPVPHPAGIFDLAKRGTTLLANPAVQYTHSETPEAPFPPLATVGAPVPTSTYLPALLRWCIEAPEKIKQGKCEIPSANDGTEEGEQLKLIVSDLYLGPGSMDAIEGCILTVCEAVDLVCGKPGSLPHDTFSEQPNVIHAGIQMEKAFCVIRPPGHHSSPDMAFHRFCYVNNVVVGAMHGYLKHDQDRSVIIDFDLHHGNGTQAILMNLNEVSHHEDLLNKGGKPLRPLTSEERHNGGRRRRGWKGFYGSLHDIWSYPCEDGSIDLIKDASVSIAAHGQYVENIHLQLYESEEDFYQRLYPKYITLLDKAKHFLQETGADPSRTTVFISAGFDACEHEQSSMQRHARKVPVSFYERITRDIAAFADKYANGKVVSVLEGGYSDKALISAAMSHVAGFFPAEKSRATWWEEAALSDIDRATRKKRNGQTAPFPKELRFSTRLKRTFDVLEICTQWGTGPNAPVVTATDSSRERLGRMTLRERSKPTLKEPYSPPPVAKSGTTTTRRKTQASVDTADRFKAILDTSPSVLPENVAQKVKGQDLSDEKTLVYSDAPCPEATLVKNIETRTVDEAKPKVILKFKNPTSNPNVPGPEPLVKPRVETMKSGIHLGLADMDKLVSLLQPIRTPHIHIAGTNGKGSVSAMIDSCAHVAGIRTGRYNSPHLITPRDAILIEGQPASQDVYELNRKIVEQTIAKHHLQNSEFEIETATAFSIFANATPSLDLLLIECGMGGLRDATNVLDKSRQICSILTVVDLDHQKFLGNTIEAITTDKLGITTAGGHLVVSKQIHPEVIDVVRRKAMENGFTCEKAVDGLSLELALPGRHQQENAATAVTVLNHIRSHPRSLHLQPRLQIISPPDIQLGLRKTQWRGRCSWLQLSGSAIGFPTDIPLLVDGAHNGSAATSLMNYVDSIRTDEPIVFLVGLSHSPPKTPLSVLQPLLARIRGTDKLLAVQFSTPVAGMPWISNVSGDEIHAAAVACGLSGDQVLGAELGSSPNLHDGLQMVMSHQKWGFVVVTGSLYLVADAYRLAGE